MTTSIVGVVLDKLRQLLGNCSEVIVLSPHPDDAAYSCGGFIGKLRAASIPVTVHTIYTKKIEMENVHKSLRSLAVDQPINLKEDVAVMKAMDCQYEYWDLQQRAFEKPALSSPAEVFKSPLGGVDGYLFKEQIDTKMREILKESPDALIICPFAIGNHYDHSQLFFSVWSLIKREGVADRFLFYEDAYSWSSNLVKAKHPVLKNYKYPLSESYLFKTIKGYFMGLLIGLLGNTKTITNELNELCEEELFSLEPVGLSEDEFKRKLQICFVYKTQMKAFGGEKLFSIAQEKAWKFWGKSEAYWKIQLSNKSED